jgi:hypothetical protein
MLNLVPLRELPSVQEVIQEDRVSLLLRLMKHKFRSAEKNLSQIIPRLQQLTLNDLEQLFDKILTFRTLKQLNQWIDQRLAEAAKTPQID